MEHLATLGTFFLGLGVFFISLGVFWWVSLYEKLNFPKKDKM